MMVKMGRGNLCNSRIEQLTEQVNNQTGSLKLCHGLTKVLSLLLLSHTVFYM